MVLSGALPPDPRGFSLWGFRKRVMLGTMARYRKRVMHMASPLPLTSVPALGSLPSVALSSDTVKSKEMLPWPVASFKRFTGRLLWPCLAGDYDPVGRGKRLYAWLKYFGQYWLILPVCGWLKSPDANSDECPNSAQFLQESLFDAPAVRG